MKTILSSKKQQYLAVAGIFLVTVALIAGTAGCSTSRSSTVSYTHLTLPTSDLV